METPVKKADRMILISGFTWAITYIGSLLVLKKLSPSIPLGITCAILPALGFVWFLWSYIRGIERMDEVHRRIHLEAVLVAFCLAILLVMVLGLLGMAVELNPEDWSYRHLVPFLFLGYFIGLFRARRKYLVHEEYD
jgi:hypothetical protein